MANIPVLPPTPPHRAGATQRIEMTRNTLSLFKSAKTAPATTRRISDDPLAGLTPVERAMAQRLTSARA